MEVVEAIEQLRVVVLYAVILLLFLSVFAGIIAYCLMAMIVQNGNPDEKYVQFAKEFLPFVKYMLYIVLILIVVALISSIGLIFVAG